MVERREVSEVPQVVHPGRLPAYDTEGVDLTLVRATLALTPRERLAGLQSLLRSLERMRDAARRR